MKIPKEKNKYCPKCKKHTLHKITIAKKKGLNATHHQTRGSRTRQSSRDRGVGIGMGNRGKFSRPPITKWKRTNKKQSKKTDLRYTCGTCKKIFTGQYSIRLKKAEIQN